MPTSKDLTDLESQVKKSLISAESFKRGSSMDLSKSILSIHKTIGTLAGHTRKLVIRVNDLEKNVNNQSKKITSLKNISKTQSERVSGENIGAKLPGGSVDNVNENIKAIADSLSSIADILAGGKKLRDATAAFDRRKAEQDKRALAESRLEKSFDGLKKVAEKIIAPVKSILDRIIDFLVTVFLGRVVYKLLEWFGDPKNADKVRSIIRFLGDHWPKLLALYLTFGTSFGRFALGLARGVAAGAVKLAFAIAKLLAAKKVKGAMGAARFLGGGKGKLLANVIGTVATVGTAYAGTQMLKGDGGGEQKTQKLAGGGYVTPRFPAFSGGGFNFKDMMGGAGLGAMFGPLGMMLGAGAGAVSGFVSGEKGVDKVPAMLSDGEFVMSRGAVQKYGVDTLESMNAAGGGTNKPKIMSGTTYAQGGGSVGANAKLTQSEISREQKEGAKTSDAVKQSQMILSSGKGLSLKGESTGRDLGTGYGAKNQGRDAVVVKGGAEKMDLSITLGGKRYYGMKRGNDAVYVALDRRDTAVPSGGLFQPGGLFGGPRMSARMDYAQSKGKYYSSSDQKTYANENDAIAAKKSRMTKLASQQRLDKLSYAGARGGSRTQSASRGVRFDAEAKARNEEFEKRGGILGGFSRFGQRLFGGPEAQKKLDAQQRASDARVKQAGAASIGRYYSSSDGKYYKDKRAAILAQEQRRKSGVKPPVKPAPKYTPAGGGMGGRRGGGGSGAGSGSQVPNIPMPKPSSAKAAVQGRNVRGGR